VLKSRVESVESKVRRIAKHKNRGHHP